jgi:hypothetical protein
MPRLALAFSLAAATLATAVASPLKADRRYSNRLDERGRQIGTSWAETGRFDALTSAGLDNVRFSEGQRWQVRASGDPRALQQLRFLVDRGSLIVGRVSGVRERYGRAQIEVTAPSISAVTAAGSGMVYVERLSGDNARATVAGTGDTTVRALDSRKLAATVAGSAGLEIAGRSESADMTIAGSGHLKGSRLTVGSANVTMAGSGNAAFRSPGTVRASIVGSGTIAVTGTTRCTQTRMGSGSLVCNR